MISFSCDYQESAHPEILKALAESKGPFPGYGSDAICESAKNKIKDAIGLPEAEIYFTVGGTQTNQLVIDTMLMPYEGVVSAPTGHINCHEAGAIEFTGHKVMEVAGELGKIKIDALKAFLKNASEDENREHMVFPGMVYISHPTEYGTLYTKQELSELSAVCREFNIPLFLDGARLGYGLMSFSTDVTLKDIAEYCDVFYIGGTKVGALFGEAVVFTKNNMPAHFLTRVKQHGALLAKGWLLGLQFDTLFTNDLYFKIGRYAIELAEKMKQMFVRKGYEFFLDSPTNQQFIVLENEKMEQLKQKVTFSFWEKVDETHTAVRFATSWSTKEEDLIQLEEIL